MNICALLPAFGNNANSENNCNSLTEWTFIEALKTIAVDSGGDLFYYPLSEYVMLDPESDIFNDGLVSWPEENGPIWVIQYNRYIVANMEYYKKIKERWPNSKIVLFGAADVDVWNFYPCEKTALSRGFKGLDNKEIKSQEWYNDYNNEFFWDLDPVYNKYQKDDEVFFTGIKNVVWDVDLYIDPQVCMVKDASKRWTSRHIIWNVATSIAEKILSMPKSSTKDADAIYMCAGAQNEYTYRAGFVQHLDSAGFKMFTSLKEHDLKKVVDFYSRSKVCLGNSCRANDHTPRGTKGMRDWIAPLCGIPLIYDDYQEIVDMKIVPTYGYHDWDGVIELTNSLAADKELYDDVVEKQKKFSLENTLDKQLTKIFNETL